MKRFIFNINRYSLSHVIECVHKFIDNYLNDPEAQAIICHNLSFFILDCNYKNAGELEKIIASVKDEDKKIKELIKEVHESASNVTIILN